MSTPFTPLGDRVLVEREEEQTTSSGGIIIPDNAKEKPLQGKVIAVGPGKQLDNGSVQNMNVKEGNRVLFGKYAGTEVTLNDQAYMVMSESDILGVLN